jgi:hypothetical protein
MKTKTAPVHRPLTRLTQSLCCAGLAALAASACASFDSGVEDLGSTDVVSQDLETPPTEPFYTSPTEFTGRWVGVADDALALGVAPGESAPAYRFPSGATSIVLELEFLDNPNVFPNLTGTITFGSGEPPPPPSDPNVGYPVGLSYAELLSYDPAEAASVFGDTRVLPPLEGFEYFISQTAFLDTRLEELADGVILLRYSTGEYLEPWCELQTPVPDGNGGYACIAPYDRTSTDDTGACFADYLDYSACPPDLEQLPIDEYFEVQEQCLQTRHEPIDCDRLFLCTGLIGAVPDGRCACTADGCFRNGLSTLYSDEVIITLRRNGDELVGIISDAVFLNPRGLRTPLGAIRFRRAP